MAISNEVEEIRELFAAQERSDVAEGKVDEPIVDEVETEEVVEEVEEVVAADGGDEQTEGDPRSEGDEPAEEKYSVASLAEAIGWEASDLYDVDVSIGTDGETVKLGKLKHQYQDAVHEREVLSTKVADMESELSAARSGVQAGQQMDQEVMHAVGQVEALKSRYQSVDWEAVEKEDPGGAALLRQKYQEAFQQADGGVRQAQYNVQARQQQGLQQAAVEMLEMIPEWKDDSVKAAEQGEIRTAMLNEGFPEEVIAQIREPKSLVHWRKYVSLLKYKEDHEAANNEAVTKVRKAPKVLKSGARIKKETKPDFDKLKESVRNASPGNRRKAEDAAIGKLLQAG